MLEINISRKIYYNKSGGTEALKQVYLQVKPGEIIGLFGENGAGKTTLLKSILGFEHYDGQILLDGEKIGKNNIARLSFATCEHSFFSNLTPEAHKEFYQMHFKTFREKRFEALMKFFELPTKKTLKNYSVGQKNQFEVIMALCQGADYILMDEPFAGNDIFNRTDFYKVLLGILEPTETIILSTHLIEEVEHFISRAILLNHGKLVGDISIMELEEQEKNLINYMKETYNYNPFHVKEILDALSEKE